MLVSELAPKVDGGAGLTGVPYYLPVAAIPITIALTNGPAASATGAPDASKPAAPTTPATGQAMSPSVTTTVSPTITVSPSISLSPATASGAGGSAKQHKLAVTIGTPVIGADPTAKYFLEYTRDPAADDTLGIHVDQNGLLATASGEAVDQTPAILASLVQTALVPFEPPVGQVHLFELSTAPQDPCGLPQYNQVVSYTPGTGFALPAITEGFAKWTGAGDTQALKIDAVNPNDHKPQSVTISITGKNSYTGAPLPKGSDGSGVLFRDWVPWQITVDVVANDEAAQKCQINNSRQVMNVFIPNGGGSFYEDMSREWLVDKKIALTVKNGMLQGVDVTRPSKLLAIVKLPLTIIQPILSAPFSAVSGTGSKSGGTGSAGGGTGGTAAASGTSK